MGVGHMAMEYSRRFNRELNQLYDKLVKVTLDSEGKKFYVGYLSAVDITSLSLSMTEAKNQNGKLIPKVLIHGKTWQNITLEEEPFPLEVLFDRISATFPRPT